MNLRWGAWRWAGPLALVLTGNPAGAASPRVAVVSHGWHAGLVLDAAALHARLPALQARFPLATHYEIGWGDQDFYPAASFSVALAVRALWASRGSVLHVVGRPGPWPHDQVGIDRVTLCISEAEQARLLAWVAQAFARQPDGGLFALGPGLYGDSQFYRSTGPYSLTHNCNHWTAQALSASGLAVSTRSGWTAGRVVQAARRAGQACPPDHGTAAVTAHVP